MKDKFVCFQEFELCTQWVQMYSVSDQSRMQLQTEYLLYLLEQNHKEDAFQVCMCVFIISVAFHCIETFYCFCI